MSEYGNVEGLHPADVEGAEPGSTYRVVVRTAKGYVGIRRIANDVFRLRCQRFDGAPIVAPEDQALIMQVTLKGLNVAENGARVSGAFLGWEKVWAHAAFLASVLLYREFDPKELPVQLDPKAQAYEDKCLAAASAVKAEQSTTAVEAEKIVHPLVNGDSDPNEGDPELN